MIRERSFGLFVILSILTCGIYSIIFWYGWNEDVNQMCENDGKEPMNFIFVLLLSMITFGIYYYIWIFRQQQRLYEIAPVMGVSNIKDGGNVLLWMLVGSLLCGLGPFIAFYNMINGFNLISYAYNSDLGTQNFN